MGTALLKEAVSVGKPLVTLGVVFRDEPDLAAIIAKLNSLTDDFDVSNQPTYSSRHRYAYATKEAAKRLFDLEIERVPLEKYDEATSSWGIWPNTYRWEQVNKPDLTLSPIGQYIESIGLSAPGPCDDGQFCE
jgi:hypothetical protein